MELLIDGKFATSLIQCPDWIWWYKSLHLATSKRIVSGKAFDNPLNNRLWAITGPEGSAGWLSDVLKRKTKTALEERFVVLRGTVCYYCRLTED